MSLSEDLQQIDGVGPATASDILDVLDNHQQGGVSERELERVLALLERDSHRVAESRLRELLQ